MDFENFSAAAGDLIALRRALYGAESAKALMLRCFRRSKADRINERTVLTCWDELDEAIKAAIESDPTLGFEEGDLMRLARQVDIDTKADS